MLLIAQGVKLLDRLTQSRCFINGSLYTGGPLLILQSR